MVFYHNYIDLCNSVNKSPSAVAEEIGLKRSVVTAWRDGRKPRQATLQKISAYFNVDVDKLLADKTKAPSEDEAIKALAEMMLERPDIRGLAEVAVAKSPDEVLAMTEFIRKMRGGT